MRVNPDHEYLQYCGRIDTSNPQAPVLVYAASYVKLRFTGTSVKVRVSNHKNYAINALGYILDGFQGRFDLVDNALPHTYVIAQDLPDGEHELMLFKRMDGCHYVTFYGFELDEDAQVLEPSPLPSLKMEVFGDSVSCGEVSEAIDYVGQSDPENHNGIFSNSYYSYSWILARKLGAQLHDTSQGGMAILDGTGWFNAPDYVGAESCYDKIQYNPFLGPAVQWDFKRYTPQIVIIALGQNDSNPEDYMARDYDCEKAVNWRKHYRQFVERLMEYYPDAHFICTTTILGHDASWDRAIGQVCDEMKDARVHHFLYSKNGCGTSGHIRIPEAEQMAEEIYTFIKKMGIIS